MYTLFINVMVVWYYCPQAYDWALECMKYISEKHDARNVKELRRYLMAHPSPTAQHFSEMMMLANKLSNDKLIKQCKVKCNHRWWRRHLDRVSNLAPCAVVVVSLFYLNISGHGTVNRLLAY